MLRASRIAESLIARSNSEVAPSNSSGLGRSVFTSIPAAICSLRGVGSIAIILAVLAIYRLSGGTFGNEMMNYTSGTYNMDQMSLNKLHDNSKLKRLYDYCPPIIPTGSEGTFPAPLKVMTDGLTLKHVLITIRHGDRSAIHKMPGSAPISLDPTLLSLGKYYLEPKALEYRDKMDSFILDPISSSSAVGTVETLSTVPKRILSESDEIKQEPKVKVRLNSLNSTVLFKLGDFELDQGKLTSKGFMQHITLGEILRKVYSGFLNENIKSPANIFVRSTAYDRTLQSVAALLTTLLPGIATAEKKISIKYHVDENMEIMHGTGLRMSSHTVSHKGETAVEGGCAKAVLLAKKEKDFYQPSQSHMASLREIFGTGVDHLFITDLADSSLPSVCHNRPLPCRAPSLSLRSPDVSSSAVGGDSGSSSSSSSGSNGGNGGAGVSMRGAVPSVTESESNLPCLSHTVLSSIMADADRAFCDRYTGQSGGDVSTKLSSYSFLKEILTTLQKASVEKDNENNVKLSVYSGHDTVIAPVLAALGLYKNDLCGWPPYASRIIFELWQGDDNNSGSENLKEWEKDEKGEVNKDKNKDKEKVKGKEDRTRSLLTKSSKVLSYVRVLYNGRDRTAEIPACIEEYEESKKGAVDSNIDGGKDSDGDKHADGGERDEDKKEKEKEKKDRKKDGDDREEDEDKDKERSKDSKDRKKVKEDDKEDEKEDEKKEEDKKKHEKEIYRKLSLSDITSQKNYIAGPRTRPGIRGLCSLHAIENQIASMLLPYTSFEEACKI